MAESGGPRGVSRSVMREAVCKDCLREERARELGTSVEELPADFDREFVYNERAAAAKLDRGQTRSDRCKRHRARHRINIQGMAVPYIDLQTIGEAVGAHSANGPTGPFGGLGPMPTAHKVSDRPGYNLSDANVGMTDGDILIMLEKLKKRRVLIAKAGTGTGKSTFMPYRLLDPPDSAPFDLAALGPIVVTEPRVQATTGVAAYVGEVLSGAGGVGPGYPVGYQVKGARAHDESCQLIYVTDGTMINWLREGRLSSIGTVIVDEAHERSTNIDFILGYLKRAVERYPHLRVIITSATFDVDFYLEYFGGEEKADCYNVDAEKTIGYGFPLFPDLDAVHPGDDDTSQRWTDVVGMGLPLRTTEDHASDAFTSAFVTDTTHFAALAPPLKADEVLSTYEGAQGVGWPELLHETTARLVPLRFDPARYDAQYATPAAWGAAWSKVAPTVLAEYIVDLVNGLDEADIYGDVLGFLPTTRNIEDAIAIIKRGLGIGGDHGLDGDRARVYPLISTLPSDVKVKALKAQVKGEPRKIVISTNLAETSLTVEGVRFVVDSGLIAQEEWDPELAEGGVFTNLHSQAGIRQRWGRVGRKSPGWAFPLYTKEQFLSLAPDTAPGSTRSNLEDLIMTAKLGGIDDVVNFDWPAKFWPSSWPHTPGLSPKDEGIAGTKYEAAAESRRIFLEELNRADVSLRGAGATDEFGDPTPFGRDFSRAPTLGSEASKIALLHADRLACVPEVATIVKLLNRTTLVGPKGILISDPAWPAEWQLEAAERHRAIAAGCSDDAELVLQVMAIWERFDPDLPSWEPSERRAELSRRWWINDHLLLGAAEVRREVLEALSPAMKEEVKRFVEPALVRRARAAITRAFASMAFLSDGAEDGKYSATTHSGRHVVTGVVDRSTIVKGFGGHIIPFKRKNNGNDTYLANLVKVESWALPPAREPGSDQHDPLDLVIKASVYGQVQPERSMLANLQAAWPAGLRAPLSFFPGRRDLRVAIKPEPVVPPPAMPAAPSQEDGDEHEDEAAVLDTVELDAHPGRDTHWPTPVSEEDEEPEDPDADLTLAALANDEDYVNACRVCARCRAGEWDQCADQLAARDPAAIEDRVGEWLKLAWATSTVELPASRVVDGNPIDGQWYEVSGYTLLPGSAELTLRPAWRQDRTPDTFPDHEGLSDGDPVEIEVGPEREGHRGTYRVLYRMAGGVRAGRFALRTTTRPGSIGLDASSAGLPPRIDGHAVRRRTAVSDTLTFVPADLTLGLLLDLPLLTLEEATAKYLPGSSLWMVVSGLLPNGARAFLRAGDGTGGTIGAKDLGVTDLSLAIHKGELVYATVRGVGEHDGRVQLQVSLRDLWSTPAGSIPSGPGQPGMLDLVPPAARVSAAVPPHWTDILCRDAVSLEVKLGATSLSIIDDRVVATVDTEEAARATATALEKVLSLPAANVVVDPSKAGLVIGRGGDTIRAASAAPGVWHYDYDAASHSVTIVAEPSALDEGVSILLGKVEGAFGRLVAGAENAGLLIGRSHSRVNAFITESGCYSAHPLRAEPGMWLVHGPDTASVHAFIDRARSVVPDLTGEITEETVAFVTDLVTNADVDDVDGHVWGCYNGGPASIDLVATPGSPARTPLVPPATAPPPPPAATPPEPLDRHDSFAGDRAAANSEPAQAPLPQPVIRDRADSCTIWDLRDGYYLIRRDSDQVGCLVSADEYRGDPRPLFWLAQL